MFRNTIAIAALSLSAILALYGPASAQRHIDENGAGNCIFGPERLPFEGEGGPAYRKVTDTFQPGQDIFVRCYYNGDLGSHKKFGRLFNSMRATGHYYGVVSWAEPLPNGKHLSHGRLRKFGNRLRFSIGNTADWDQQSLKFAKDDCDFTVEAKDISKYGAYRNKCVNFFEAAKVMTRKHNSPYTDKAKFCLEILLTYSDKKRERWVDGTLVHEDIKDYRKMSGGCFYIDMK